MRRAFLALLGLSVIAALVAAVAWARPNLVPRWARFGEAKVVKDYGLYCKEHGVPEKFCTLCHPELKDKLLLLPGARQHPGRDLHALPPRG